MKIIAIGFCAIALLVLPTYALAADQPHDGYDAQISAYIQDYQRTYNQYYQDYQSEYANIRTYDDLMAVQQRFQTRIETLMKQVSATAAELTNAEVARHMAETEEEVIDETGELWIKGAAESLSGAANEVFLELGLRPIGGFIDVDDLSLSFDFERDGEPISVRVEGKLVGGDRGIVAAGTEATLQIRSDARLSPGTYTYTWMRHGLERENEARATYALDAAFWLPTTRAFVVTGRGEDAPDTRTVSARVACFARAQTERSAENARAHELQEARTVDSARERSQAMTVAGALTDRDDKRDAIKDATEQYKDALESYKTAYKNALDLAITHYKDALAACPK